MRVIQFQISGEKRDAARRILEREDINYIITDAASETGNDVIIQFPVPMHAVDYVLQEFRDAGIDIDEQYRVNLNAEVARTKDRDGVLGQFLSGGGNYISREELRVRARDMNPSVVTYYMMTILGVVVATSGLLLNSAAVVVGSMVLAPQLGAALTAGVGITVNDRDMVVDGFTSQATGLGLGLLGSVLFGTLLRWGMVVPPNLNITALPQIGGRISPGLLSVLVSVAAGTAAAFSLATHDSPGGPLVGVMVSAALIPAAATAGIGIAWGFPKVTVGALVLLVVNVMAINMTGPVILWALGYRPTGWDEDSLTSLRSLTEYPTSTVTMALLILGVVAAGGMVSQQIVFDQAVKSSVNEVLERPEYEEIEIRDISTEFSLGTGDDSKLITIVVSRDSGERHPHLGSAIDREISEETKASVTVQVKFVDANQTSPENSRRRPETSIAGVRAEPPIWTTA